MSTPTASPRLDDAPSSQPLVALPSAWSLPEVVASLPAACVLLTPTLHVAAASDAYLAVFGLTRAQLLGRTLFEVFPGPPGTPEGDTITSLRASLQQVLATGEPHHMAVQRYDVPDPATPGQFLGRYWDPTNSAIRDAQGSVTGLVHSIVNVTERVQAEAELAASQARERAALAEAETQRLRLYNVLMELPAQVAVYQGSDHLYQLVSPNYQRMFPHRTFVGRPFREGMPEAEGLGVVALFDQVYQTGEPYYGHEMEGWFDFGGHGQPEQFFFELSLHPLRNAQGEIDGVLDFSYEVTEQVLGRRQLQQVNEELETRVQQRTQELEASHQAAEALQADLLTAAQRQVQEREGFYQVFEQTSAVVLLLREPDHRVEYVNPSSVQLMGNRLLRGRPLLEGLPEAETQGFLALLDGVYQTGETFRGTELPFTVQEADRPPRTIYFSFSYQAYREQGRIVGVSAFGYDVTEQVIARQQREVQQHLVEALFAQAPVAIWVTQGPEHVFELVNPLMAQIFGRAPAELLGRPYLEAIPELVSQGAPDLLARTWQGEVVHIQEYPARLAYHGEEEIGYFSFVFQPLRNEWGQVHRLACVAVDVTTQVLARQQVQRLNEQLTATNEELHETNHRLLRTNADLDNFVYTASHDLKSPISNIEGLLALLPELLPTAVLTDAHVAPVLDRMHESIERFRRTITHLTDVSRLQAEFAQPTETVLLAAIIEDVREDLHFQFLATGAMLEVAVDETQPRVFSPKNLRSLIHNLLSNALKYRHPERTPLVRISCQPAGDSLELRVRDNGLGLSTQQRQRLFQLFQRLHTHVEGSGVGLYAVKKIVENAGGRIAVESELGVGTTFLLTFPA